MLKEIRRGALPLTTSEQWHLRYLEAWETMYEGNYARSQFQLREIIDTSGDKTLAIKASALLLSNLAASRRYEEAYALANRLTMDLPQVKDPQARFMLLMNLSQMLDFAGQARLAIQYARMMESSIPAGETLCRPYYLQAAALFNGKRLSSSSPELRRAIDVCETAKQPIYADALWLVLDSLYLREGRPEKALALLDQVSPDIRINRYYPHVLSAQVKRAQAYAKLGRDGEAKQAALAAVAMGHPEDVNERLMQAYEVLYQIEKRQGHAAAALNYYEHYAAQDKGYLNDVSARALAYETAQQHLLAQKLETEKLSRQNKILRLQQALNAKAVETGRLYIVLLLLALASVVFWLLRLKRSQLRFKKLSCQDGLTAICNRQYFMGEAERVLRLLEKRQGVACLMFIDLDHFKRINDTHGHATGDAVLRHAVALCRQQLRPADLFGRLGGEEFGILLADCPRERGRTVANRIRAAIDASPLQSEGFVVAYSASVGLACTDILGYGLQRLCREADAALYRAKRGGRNRVVADGGDGALAEA
ncbi:GGDEF domain-containing protein [Fulvimonas sp. R45]|uniref:tetratricopeptide repeat-containing diguanylate cyclase n=1 Tax=Fulvimonas sp. R45 TaxID=3045937 RepID=UPI00265EBBE7|nr:GGDEF domain-containing protein [Fulvimonas sp. R45]MDO1529483.1 GGDEF domain-containing protein [Fulvimonas sp. R45]